MSAMINRNKSNDQVENPQFGDRWRTLRRSPSGSPTPDRARDTRMILVPLAFRGLNFGYAVAAHAAAFEEVGVKVSHSQDHAVISR